MSDTKENWSVSGCTITVDPGESETLLEWRCLVNHTAKLTEHTVGCEDPVYNTDKELFHTELAFETLHQNPEQIYVYHLNPNRWKKHLFQTAVKLVVTNNSDTSIDVWGTFKGNHYLVDTIFSGICNKSSTQKANISETHPLLELIKEEEAMNENDLTNSHDFDNLPIGSMPTVGLHKATLPTYGDGDFAALHMDNRGRLLVAVDGISDHAQQQIIELNTLNSELSSKLFDQTAEAALKRQKEDSEHFIKRQELVLQREKSADSRDEAVNRTDIRAKTVISGRRYAFLSTLVRWAALAGAAITMTYFLA